MIAGASFSEILRSKISCCAPPRSIFHEDQGRNPQPLQRPHQHAGLRLHALDGGNDKHGAVEHVQDPFYLGDEIRVPGRIDQVDLYIVDSEDNDGGPYGYAALLL